MKAYINPRHKILGHINRLQAIKAGEKPPPINIEIDSSNRCSLGCDWCHFAYTHTRGPLAGKVVTPNGRMPGGDLMEYDLAKSIIIQAKEMGVRSLTWTGGGEPTLHPRFDDIIEFAYRHGVVQGLYTHGGHIDANRAGLLKKAMQWVYVSLDEVNQKEYKISKGVDGFDRAISGIEHLAAVNGQATIGVGFLLHHENYYHCNEMIELAINAGADYVQFRPAVAYYQNAPDQLRDYPPIDWIDHCLYLFERIDEPQVLIDRERFEMYRDWNGRSYHTCYWTLVQSVITPDGSVWTCVNKREHQGEQLGNLSVETLQEIWQRRMAVQVDGGCRVMCRGHIANITLDSVMNHQPHGDFI